ncbi:MAG: hemerythrin domain-containing protein [Phycisphaerae bacterium]|nr:hemerythrin domain-containing protein [Phycisphaerae bacterium]MCZ2399086.1 hemerythrin domain-containing protein [Phycisphaerae bacterium]
MTQHSCDGCEHGPTGVLKAEHRVIERVVDAMERVIEQRPLDAGFFAKAIDFLRNFTDGCHHAKEEDQLFPTLEAAGVPRERGPIGCMLEEHARGRALVRRMSETLEAAAGGSAEATLAFEAAVRSYVDLLRQHIWKEDNVLFSMADRVLDTDGREALSRAFDAGRQGAAAVDRREHYARVADELHRGAFAGAAGSERSAS